MQYLGGKSRLSKSISAAILADTDARGRYIEPMVGGGSMLAAMAPHFAAPMAGDVVPDLVMLWEAVQRGWIPPSEVSENDYQGLMAAPPSAMRGFAGYGASFGGKWWGGYARNSRGDDYVGQAQRSLLRKAAVLANNPVWFECISYDLWPVSAGDVVYLDPPYAGTTGYAAAGTFDHERFWRIADSWRELGAHVYVSEFTAPAGWREVWARERLVGIDNRREESYRLRVDRLFA